MSFSSSKVLQNLSAQVLELLGTPQGQSVKRPIAVFDFDGTLLKQDFSEAVFQLLLEEHFLTDQQWRQLIGNNFALSELGKQKLSYLFETSAQQFRSTLSDVYFMRITSYAEFFVHANGRFYHPGYDFLARFFDQLPSELWEPLLQKTWQKMAITWHQDLVDFKNEIESMGVECWAVSASNQRLVQWALQKINWQLNQVIGVVPQEADQLGTGHGNVPLMSYAWGKRYHINKRIYGSTSPHIVGGDWQRRPMVAAGNTRGDYEMLSDAWGLKIFMGTEQDLLEIKKQGLDTTQWLLGNIEANKTIS